MRLTMSRAAGVLLLSLIGLFPCAGASADASAAPRDAEPVIILRTAIGKYQGDDPGSMWRYFETWQSDITRVNGKLVHVDVFQ
ncbi:MAG TPA: hypothetical protein VMY39_00040, partial [Planctomycetota bacterium]|nr:hypothetical protein [Planctomycetota bacterium]